MPKLSRRAPLVLLVVCASGCQMGYVLKQGLRHLSPGREEVPLDSPDIEVKAGADVAEKLRWVPRILEFSRTDLGLDPGDSYTTFVDTRGEPVSHAVTASHPLALIPFEWRFPFAGRVPYKGFFDEADARAEGDRLRRLGFEASVFPVSAFSTLGWFRDPVLSSMLDGSTADLIDVIIHETTHRTVYFQGHASFNESLATYIARRGTLMLLSRSPELAAETPAYIEGREAGRARERLLLRLRSDLDALYRSPREEAAKRERKQEIFATAQMAYRKLHGGGSISASNAFVLSVARYHQFEPLFERLEAKLGGGPAVLVAYLKGLRRGEDPAAQVMEKFPDLRNASAP